MQVKWLVRLAFVLIPLLLAALIPLLLHRQGDPAASSPAPAPAPAPETKSREGGNQDEGGQNSSEPDEPPAASEGWQQGRAVMPEETVILPPGTVADFILIEKARRRLSLYQGDRRLKSYRIGLGPSPVGDKTREGDGKTPEGRYEIDWRNPDARYHLSLHISYPDAWDKAEAKAAGVKPGGDIMIHGQPNELTENGTLAEKLSSALLARRDWTAGCIAVTNAEIREIWEAVPNGTPIEILP